MTEKTPSLPVKEYLLKFEPCAHGGLIRKSSQKYAIPESEILDVSANLNPYGTPFEHSYTGLVLQDLLDKGLMKLEQYPDNRYLEFREAAARFTGLGTKPENIIPGNGSTEIIRLVAECMIGEGDVVLVPQPTFSEYEVQCRVMGANIRYIRQEDLHDLKDDILSGAKMLFVCNPNNPTGKLLSREQVRAIAEKCAQHHVVLFLDEAFIELADPAQSVADLVEGNDHLFIQRSLTKAFAIPGIRMGFGIASSRLATLLNGIRLSWNLGCIADTVSTALLNMEGGVNSQYLKESRKLIEEERKFLMQKLDRRGFKPMESTVNYIYVDISDFSMSSTELAQRMATHGVLIRDCRSFQESGADHIRIAVRTRKENERLVNTIRQVVSEWGHEQSESMLDANIARAAEHGRLGRNMECEYYPCHFDGQDCTFCFCPFYPCKDERTGGQWIDSSSGDRVWSCLYCEMVHRPDIVDELLAVFVKEGRTDKGLKEAWGQVMEKHL